MEQIKELSATKITITAVCDGLYSTKLGPYIVPDCVAQKILCDLIDWKERWHFTPKEYEGFLENEKILTINKTQQ